MNTQRHVGDLRHNGVVIAPQTAVAPRGTLTTPPALFQGLFNLGVVVKEKCFFLTKVLNILTFTAYFDYLRCKSYLRQN